MAKKILLLTVLLVLAFPFIQNIASADGGPEHQTAQTWPIKLGVSGGNVNDRSASYCCSGTLGVLVEDGTNQYILSNNHVLARTNLGIPGEEITHPGAIDQGCGRTGAVASLSDFVEIRFKKASNEVDAAIAMVYDGAVETSGEILDIGQVSSETTTAVLGQKVQKSGRTTGHTTGTVTAIGVTVNVGYSRECGGPSNLTAQFDNQIIIEGTGGAFSSGGDSGSLIVEDIEVSPRAVGLLFAGNSTITVANPIDAVLNALSVVMCGGTPPVPEPTPKGSISGKVTNSSTGNPIDKASVSTETGESTETGADGSYLLSDVPAGYCEVTASASGFKTQTKSVTVGADTTVTQNFALRPGGGGGKDKKTNPGLLRRAVGAKNRYVSKFMDIDGVEGMGVGLSDTGQPAVQIYLSDDSDRVKNQIPSKLDDVEVVTIVTGTFEAF